MRELRVCFGTEGDRRSSVWKIWTRGRETYLLSRMMGSSTKVSLHSDCQGRWSMTSEWYGRHRPNQPNRGRHIVLWTWNLPGAGTASHVFRLIVSGSELRVIPIAEDLHNVRWLDQPAIGSAGTVDIYVSPAHPNQATMARPDFLSALDLDGDMSVVVFVSYSAVSDADRIQINQARTSAASQAVAAGVAPNGNFRGTLLFRSDSDVQGMVEFVPFADGV